MTGKTIVVTGSTGQVGFPVAAALAADGNEVLAAARFSRKSQRARLEAAGVTCVTVDLASGDFSALPSDPDHVLNFAVGKTNDWTDDLAANAESIGLLMAHCRGATSVLHCSTTGVYHDTGGPYAETDPLGDNHRVSPFLQTYSISKIAAEAVVSMSAKLWDLPTTIARLNVPYGDNGGWPAIMLDMALGGVPVEVPATGPANYNLIHEDDIVTMVPKLLEIASVPPTIVNWAGEETVSIQEWTAELTALTGVEIPLVESETAMPSVTVDTAKLRELVGPATVTWRDGLRRMVAARHPELLRP